MKLYLRLVERTPTGSALFFGIARQMMRRILVDHANTECRKTRRRIEGHLDEKMASPRRKALMFRFDIALAELSKPMRNREKSSSCVSLPLSIEETAEAMSISAATV
jgi:hypothetical protein